MAEALTVIEVALCITEIVERLCTFISTVKSAKDDIRKLAQELFALRGALDHFDVQVQGASDTSLQEQVQSMLVMTQETLEAIAKKLGSPKSSKMGRAVQSLAWPFRVGDVEKYLATIERAKTWFIMVLMRDSLDTTMSVFAEMQQLTALIHEDIIARKTDRMVSETSDLLRWLSPVDSREKLRDSVVDRVPGTGQWIHAGRLSVWERGGPTESPVFWIAGRCTNAVHTLELCRPMFLADIFPSSHLVEKLQIRVDSFASEKDDRTGLGFHCCSLDDAASQAIPNIFGSVLAQIGTLRPEVLDHVRPLRKLGDTLIPQNNLSIEQIHEVMDKALESFDVFYLMIDALNETPHEDLVVEALLAMCKRHECLRVLVTCTREPVRSSPMIYIRHMTTASVDLDIEMYVQNRLACEHSFQTLSSSIREDIRAKIVADAHGTFRWAKLCMDRLSTLRTGRDVRRILADIPSTLNETYAGILGRIPNQDHQIAREALAWLCFSLRPLSLDELAEAIIIEEDDTEIDADCRLTNSSVVPAICQGLVHASKSSVTLAHDSIRTFLQSDWIRNSSASYFALDASEVHRSIMRKCLTYLSLTPFASGPLSDLGQVKRCFTMYPFLDYASTTWPIHSERFALDNSDENLILGFFATKKQHNGGPFEAWVQLILNSDDLEAIHETEPLYYAASFNMLSVMQLLLKPEHKVDVNKKGGRFSSTPLFVALWRGNVDAAKLLVQAGADPDIIDKMGVSSRRFALARKGMHDVVDLMGSVSSNQASRRFGPASASADNAHQRFLAAFAARVAMSAHDDVTPE
ncbi:ankyrin repeat protein [Colletotrichum musicola]|uniref:Ankyrin repeat protein n=1 Tax=Colletotrichum musicola TaxID=2175873 RepID=A0A8H6NMM5_9PEZI|nr:ankyrin repeat protein [Colletotrichum musicola]